MTRAAAAVLQEVADNAFLSLGGDSNIEFVTARDALIEDVFTEVERLGKQTCVIAVTIAYLECQASMGLLVLV